MIFNHNYSTILRDRNQSWFLREMCRDLKDYLLTLSYDDEYTNTLYHIDGVLNGETTEILTQEFPFLNITCIDDWTAKTELEMEFENRSKYYPNMSRWNGEQNAFTNDIQTPCMVYLDNCGDEEEIVKNLKFWLPRMSEGSVISGHCLRYDSFRRPNSMTKVKGAIIKGIGDFPNKTYLDGSWYYCL